MKRLAAVLLLAFAACGDSPDLLNITEGVVFLVEPASPGSFSGSWSTCGEAVLLEGTGATRYWLSECGKVWVELNFEGGPGCLRIIHGGEISGLLVCGERIRQTIYPGLGFSEDGSR